MPAPALCNCLLPSSSRRPRPIYSHTVTHTTQALAPPQRLKSAAAHHTPIHRSQQQASNTFAAMIKLRYSKRLFKRSSSSKQQQAAACGGGDNGVGGGAGEIEWEVRPGGMLVQKRDGRGGQEMVTVRVSTGFSWHDVSIAATSTFGELKVMLSMITGLEPREQRLLFRGKERDDTDHLHMVGVRDKDKVLLLEDPALKDMKLRALSAQVVRSSCQPFIQV